MTLKKDRLGIFRMGRSFYCYMFDILTEDLHDYFLSEFRLFC